MDNLEIEDIYIDLLKLTFKKLDINNWEDKNSELLIKLKECSQELISALSEKELKLYIQFIFSPQIYDLLAEYLFYNMILDLFNVERDFVTSDNCMIYCNKVLAEYFSELYNENLFSVLSNYLVLYYNGPKIYLISPQMDGLLLFKLRGDSFNRRIIERDVSMEIKEKINSMISYDFIQEKEDKMKLKYDEILQTKYEKASVYFINNDYSLDDFYIPPILKGNSYISHLEFENLFMISNVVYIIGGPGYGKSLYLKHIINKISLLTIPKSNDYLMILCDLKTYFTNGNVNKKTIIDFLLETIINMTGISISRKMLCYYLNIGRTIVLLDALDEVPQYYRESLHKKIINFISTVNSNNKICITSRNRGFFPENDIIVNEIEPLNFEDVKQYIDNMIRIKKFRKESKDNFLLQAEKLVDNDFLSSFLVLSLLVNIYKSENELPENKIELYQKCFESIAKKREERNLTTGYNWNYISPLMKDSTFIYLSTLCMPNNSDVAKNVVEKKLVDLYKIRYSNEVSAENAIKEFLEFCSSRTEIFILSSSDEKFKFFHRSFFEYFYSKFICREKDIFKIYDYMSQFDMDSEVFELTVALIKNEDILKYQELVKYIFDQIALDFDEKRSRYIPFKILLNCADIIDEKLFLDKLYSIIIKYSCRLVNNEMLLFDNKKMYINIMKTLINDERKNKFKEKYEKNCLFNLLSLLEILQNSKFKSLKMQQQQSFTFYLKIYFDIFGIDKLFYDFLHKDIKNKNKWERKYDKIYSLMPDMTLKRDLAIIKENALYFDE